jgi:hypothetical protein
MTVQKGDVFDWNGVTCTVKRVAQNGRWADLDCTTSSAPFSPPGWAVRKNLTNGELPPDYVKLNMRKETFIVELLIPPTMTVAMALVELKTSIGFGNPKIRALIDVTDEVDPRNLHLDGNANAT